MPKLALLAAGRAAAAKRAVAAATAAATANASPVRLAVQLALRVTRTIVTPRTLCALRACRLPIGHQTASRGLAAAMRSLTPPRMVRPCARTRRLASAWLPTPASARLPAPASARPPALPAAAAAEGPRDPGPPSLPSGSAAAVVPAPPPHSFSASCSRCAGPGARIHKWLVNCRRTCGADASAEAGQLHLTACGPVTSHSLKASCAPNLAGWSRHPPHCSRVTPHTAADSHPTLQPSHTPKCSRTSPHCGDESQPALQPSHTPHQARTHVCVRTWAQGGKHMRTNRRVNILQRVHTLRPVRIQHTQPLSHDLANLTPSSFQPAQRAALPPPPFAIMP
eukprot:358390-Chlamydomonas_euryale.AAC.1